MGLERLESSVQCSVVFGEVVGETFSLREEFEQGDEYPLEDKHNCRGACK